MRIEIARETEALRQGISMDVTLKRLVNAHGATAYTALSSPELPVWHLGGVGALHRRDI
jgi:hypothetical protein